MIGNQRRAGKAGRWLRPTADGGLQPKRPNKTVATPATGTTSYDGTPFSALPPSGLAVVEGDRLVLLDYDGKWLGEASTPVGFKIGVKEGLDVVVVAARP